MGHPSKKGLVISEKTRLIQKEIVQARREGTSFERISENLGVSTAYTYKMYKQALKDIIVEDVEDLRKLELAKIEALEQEVLRVLRAFHPVVSSGQVIRDIVDGDDGEPLVNPVTGSLVTLRLQDQGPKLAAIDRAVKLMERRARLLGLDAPQKTALTDPSGDKEAAFVQFYLPENGR